jgi:hypothetical protein
MSDHEVTGRTVYDHDNDEPRPSGRRRRQVADWGVGEELFDHMPRPRFERRHGGHDIPRGGVADGRRTVVIGDEHAELPDEDALRDRPVEYATREEALRARAADEALWHRDEPSARRAGPARGDDESVPRARPARGDDESVPRAGSARGDDESVPRARAAVSASPPRSVRPADAEPKRAGGPGGAHPRARRTVKIGGRPGAYDVPRAARRRPPRTVGERVGARPDRIAAWAFALGMLLILIAVVTAQI